MADHSKIEWTEATWNFVTGCTRISAGCDRCYIERTPPFRMAGRRFDKPGIGGTTGVALHSERLHLPLRWRKPRRVFVNSLSDLFHDQVPTEFIAEAFAVMARAPQHVFQLLTKRHARLRSLLNNPDFVAKVQRTAAQREGGTAPAFTDSWWPLPNVHVGVSVENQKWADARVPALLDTPAAVRWLSCEPLLGSVDLTWCGGVNALEQDWIGGPGGGSGAPHPFVDWVVCGGESGPGARHCDLGWLRSMRDQCASAGVPVFVKQLGAMWAKANRADSHGGDWDRWPADLKVRQYPKAGSLPC